MEILEKLYDIVIDKLTLSYEMLIEYGLTDANINYLIDKNILTVVNGELVFNDVDGLFKYGTSSIVKFDFEKGKACFRACVKLYPFHRNTLLQKVLQHLRAGNITTAIEYFNKVLGIEPEKYYNDNNLFMHLFNIIDPKSNVYGEMVDKDAFVSIEKSKRETIEDIENDIRRIIYENRLILAMKVLNDLLADNPTYNIERVVLKELLSKAIEVDKNQKKTLDVLIMEEKYEDALELLSRTKNIRRFTANEFFIYKLLNVIIYISITKQIPLITNKHPKNLSEAIKGNNFKIAIIINKQFLKNSNKSEKEDSVLILLKKVCTLINQINAERDISSSIDFIKSESNETKNLNDILYFMKQDMLPYELVVQKYDLTLEEALDLKLLMAEDSFELGLVNIGEKYLQEVKDMSLDIESICEKIAKIESRKKAIINGQSLKLDKN